MKSATSHHKVFDPLIVYKHYLGQLYTFLGSISFRTILGVDMSLTELSYWMFLRFQAVFLKSTKSTLNSSKDARQNYFVCSAQFQTTSLICHSFNTLSSPFSYTTFPYIHFGTLNLYVLIFQLYTQMHILALMLQLSGE